MARRRLLSTLVATFVVGAAPIVASASRLVTVPLFPSGADNFYCQLANVSTKPRVARIEILNTGAGTVQSDSGEITLNPGEGTVRQATSLSAQYVCRFTVDGRRNFRGSATIFTGTGSDFVVAPAQ